MRHHLVRSFLALTSGALLCATAVCAWMSLQPFVGGGPALTAVLGSLLLLSASIGAALASLLQKGRARTVWAGVAWAASAVFLLAAQRTQHLVLAALEPHGLLVAVGLDFLVFFLFPVVLTTALLFSVPGSDGRLRSATPAWLAVSVFAAATTFGVSIQWGLAAVGVSPFLTGTAIGSLVCAAVVFAVVISGRRRRAGAITAAIVAILIGATAPQPGPHPHGLRVLQHTGTTEMRVLDHAGYRYLLLDGEPAIAVDPVTGEAVAPDPSTLELMLQFFWPPGRALLVGIPDPQFVRTLSQRGWQVDVSAPQAVLALANRYLGFDGSRTTWIAPDVVRATLLDPRRATLPQRYQVIVVQLRGAAGGLQDFATREGVQALRRSMDPDGILLLRLEAPGWGHAWPRSVGAVLLGEFQEVWCLPVTGGPRNAGSLVMAASDRYLEIRHHHLPTPQDHPNHPEAQLQSGRARNAWRYRFVPEILDAQILELSHNPAPHWLDAFQRADRQRLHRRLGGHGFTW